MSNLANNHHQSSEGRTERLFWIAGWAYDFSKIATVILVLGLIVNYFFLSILVVRGSSMEPNYLDGQVYVINKLAYRLHSPQQGDVIAMFFPGETQKRFIKRIVGLPGQTVAVHDGHIFINNQLLKEPYLDPALQTEPALTVTLVAGEYFVCGDNREVSSDSRAWGPVPASFIIGKVGSKVLTLPSQLPAT